ncbi:MAG: hypothetical protein AVDCRST_MAG70-2201, partial [uncultured Thermomicrobiales bacterium]
AFGRETGEPDAHRPVLAGQPGDRVGRHRRGGRAAERAGEHRGPDRDRGGRDLAGGQADRQQHRPRRTADPDQPGRRRDPACGRRHRPGHRSDPAGRRRRAGEV